MDEGFLEKLKKLVASMDAEEESSVEDIEMPETMGLEPISSTVSDENSSFQETPDYIECKDEESLVIARQLVALRNTKLSLAELSLNYENRKQLVLEQIKKRNEELVRMLTVLKDEYNIPDDGYSIELPADVSDKVSFVKD